jgi:protein O-GlcNAc transferase
MAQHKTQLTSKLQQARKHTMQSTACSDIKESQNFRKLAINIYKEALASTDVIDYLLIDSDPEISEAEFVEMNFNLGTLYKTFAETELQSASSVNAFHFSLFDRALDCFKSIIKVKFEHKLATKQMVSVYTMLCYVTQSNLQKSLEYLQTALLYSPSNETVHYNLGHVYHKMNKLELALIHYKLSLEMCDHKSDLSSKEKDNLVLNNYNGIASLFKGIKQWPEALYFLKKAMAIDENDPDINNQLGIVYTEMRRTDLAIRAYERAIQNNDRCFISPDKTKLLSDTFLNLGHMHSYNGNNTLSIEAYNKSLQVLPTNVLPFQNKLMNLSYVFDKLEDKKYILNQHKLVNKLFPKRANPFTFDQSYYNTKKINIGIVSGDFVDHPVQFFISTFLRNFDPDAFTVTCYSECLINTKMYHSDLQFKFIKNTSAETAASVIHNDKIHILLDLAGHTAFNRLDVFALKPAPIQITYVGYPYTTGLDEMDYRITDRICDDPNVSQQFYSEKLLYLKDSFLCYDPVAVQQQGHYNKKDPNNKDILPRLENQPYLQNGRVVTIACFNRLNKISDDVIKLFNNILVTHTFVRFVFKTKALLNNQVKLAFLAQFDESVKDRILIKDCTITHNDHLLEYNKVDVAIDTFPYSGTTTSCEALLQGVPVFTLRDNLHSFHPQNVTSSILTNSNLSQYVCNSIEEVVNKVGELQDKPDAFWKNLKSETRSQFLRGKVCDKKGYMQNIQTLFKSLVVQSSKQTQPSHQMLDTSSTHLAGHGL